MLPMHWMFHVLTTWPCFTYSWRIETYGGFISSRCRSCIFMCSIVHYEESYHACQEHQRQPCIYIPHVFMGSIHKCKLQWIFLFSRCVSWFPTYFGFVLAQSPIPLHGCLRDVDHTSCHSCIEYIYILMLPGSQNFHFGSTFF